MTQITTETTGVEPTTEGAPDKPQSVDPNPSLAEANARYVRERDGAREELAAASARIEQMQTREVERIASGSLSAPTDLLTLGGVTVADLLDGNGDVDPDKVNAVAVAVLADRPGLGKRTPGYDPSQGTGGRAAPPERVPTMADLFKGGDNGHWGNLSHYASKS